MTELEILSHDGPARLGMLQLDDLTIPTPCGAYFTGCREGFRIFELGTRGRLSLAIGPSEGVYREDNDLPPGGPDDELLVASPSLDEPELRQGVFYARARGDEEEVEARGMVILECGETTDLGRVLDMVIGLRRRVSPNVAILLPDIDIWAMPLLSLAGADIFADSHAWSAMESEERVFPTYSAPVDDEGVDCYCPFCADNSLDSRSRLISHNRLSMKQVLSDVRNRIWQKELKLMAEARSVSHPEVFAALRTFLSQHGDYLERHTTVCPGAGKTIRFTDLSLKWPEVVRFRQRIASRYRTPRGADCVVILPCSKRKPYSRSPSHRMFQQALKPMADQIRIEEVILTSPLGAVPRALEGVPPPRDYDIPVTGKWSQEEVEMAARSLSDLLPSITRDESQVVVHVSGGYLRACKRAERELGWSFQYTDASRPASREGINLLEKALSGVEGKKPKTDRLDRPRKVLTYQYGRQVSEALTDRPVEVKAQGNVKRLIAGGEPVARLNPYNGLYTPEPVALDVLNDLDRYCVDIDFHPETKVIYCPGVISANDEIRPDDEVAVRLEDKVVAQGRAVLPGREMVSSTRGKAVLLRTIYD